MQIKSLYPYHKILQKGVFLAGILYFTCCLPGPVAAQELTSPRVLLGQLDSIRQSSAVARHFAAIYFETTERAIQFFETGNESGKARTERFELAFAGYFLRAVKAHQNGGIPADGWKDYFADTALTALHYQLMGINAHINGDIWQALVAQFSPTELKAYRTDYRRFQRTLNQQYRRFFDQVMHTHQLTRFIHGLSLGFDKWYGQFLLVKWRKRQYRLATLYYRDPSLFEKRRLVVTEKMKRINRLILRRL